MLFWERHALLAGLSSSIIIVMLTVGVFNEAPSDVKGAAVGACWLNT